MKPLLLYSALLFPSFMTCASWAQDEVSDGIPAEESVPKFRDGTRAEMTLMYRGAETPAGIVFETIIHRMAGDFPEVNPRALSKLKRKLAIDSDDEALKFIQRLAAEIPKLDRARTQAEHTFVCSARPKRSKRELFNDLDELARVHVALAGTAYDEFSASLDSEQASRFAEWIEESKAGSAFYATSAKQGIERMGVDAIAHYKQKCIEIEQKLEGMK